MTNDIFADMGRHYITLHYVCKYELGEPRVMEPEKCAKWEWFRWDSLPEPLFPPVRNLVKQGFSPFDLV